MNQIVVQWNAKKLVQIAVLESFLILAIAAVAFRLWKIDFSVPFNYWGDTLWFLVPIKGMIENGWTYEVPQLSAPFGLSVAAFPSMTHLDWLIMKVITVFTGDAGTVINVFWLFSLVLTAWSATLALHFIGIKDWRAVGVGIVYSFLPYALLRNVAHISLVYYCVPLLVLLSIYLAQGCEHPQARKVRLIGYCAALAQGFNYIYFSFFAVLLFTFAGWHGFRQRRSWKPVKEATIAICIIIMAASINLLPSFISWQTHGKPSDMNYKSPQEAEIYGLKIRKMLVPNDANRVPIFKQWAQRDRSIGFPNENENVTARLGPMAATGLLLLLMISAGLVGQQVQNGSYGIKSTASLALFILLFATVGGFGAIFNQMLPDFRTYNRFSVFIAFLALAGLALWWQTRIRIDASPLARKFLEVVFIVLLAFSLYDQLLDADHLNNRRPADERSAMHEREVVKHLEAELPSGTSIYQLPMMAFPVDGGKERMLPYDHARPYLWSSDLHWSWPSFSSQHRTWANQMNGLEGEQLAEALVVSNFGVIWIDRYGYKDNGERIISSLSSIGANDILSGLSTRYVALDLTKKADRLKQQLGVDEFSRRQADLLAAPTMTWGTGVYALEENRDGRKFRWSQSDSSVRVSNFGSFPWSGVLSFSIATAGKSGKVTVSTETQSATAAVASAPIHIEVPLSLKANSKIEVRFVGDMGKIDLPPAETRDLHFFIMDMQLLPTIKSKLKFGEKNES